MTEIIALILRSIATAAQLNLFGGKADKLVPVLNTVARLAELPAETRAEQEALLAQVRAWVSENREPTDEELDAFKSKRNELDERLKAARDSLPNGAL